MPLDARTAAALFEPLGAGMLPKLRVLELSQIPDFGDAGSDALAAAVGRRAMPALEILVMRSSGFSARLLAGLPARAWPQLTELTGQHGPAFGEAGCEAFAGRAGCAPGAVGSRCKRDHTPHVRDTTCRISRSVDAARARQRESVRRRGGGAAGGGRARRAPRRCGAAAAGASSRAGSRRGFSPGCTPGCSRRSSTSARQAARRWRWRWSGGRWLSCASSFSSSA
eukprot:806316-Rhodomonas_salina.1